MYTPKDKNGKKLGKIQKNKKLEKCSSTLKKTKMTKKNWKIFQEKKENIVIF